MGVVGNWIPPDPLLGDWLGHRVNGLPIVEVETGSTPITSYTALESYMVSSSQDYDDFETHLAGATEDYTDFEAGTITQEEFSP